MKAWQLLKSNKNWCRGNFARDNGGMGVPPDDPTAFSFCAVGALRKIYTEGTMAYFYMDRKLREYIVLKTQFKGTTSWNDHKNQRWNRVKEVLKKLDI